MSSRTWRWIVLTVSAATIGAAGGFIASVVVIGSDLEPFRTPKWWSYATTAGAVLSWIGGERYRAAVDREWAHAGGCRCSRCLLLPWKGRP